MSIIFNWLVVSGYSAFSGKKSGQSFISFRMSKERSQNAYFDGIRLPVPAENAIRAGKTGKADDEEKKSGGEVASQPAKSLME